MNILIKGGFIFLLAAISVACGKADMISSSEKQDQHFYKGSSSHVGIFIKTAKDTAAAKWFCFESSPGLSFTDTLIRDKQDPSTWRGRISRLYENRKQLSFETARPFRPDKNMRIKLKPSTGEKWIRSFNLYNNSFLLSSEFQTFIHETSGMIGMKDKLKLWNKMYDEYNLDEKLISLDITEFTSEVEKFRCALLQKIRNY